MQFFLARLLLNTATLSKILKYEQLLLAVSFLLQQRPTTSTEAPSASSTPLLLQRQRRLPAVLFAQGRIIPQGPGPEDHVLRHNPVIVSF